ncbi:MAG: FAD binding domain-containing protein, partial [Candidatus Limnocylindrales bacterium]
MIPAVFDYARPTNLDEALALLGRSDGSAKVLAGGQSLLPLMRLRLASPAKLIDIGRIAELRAIRDLGAGATGIGALATYRAVLDSDLAVRNHPILATAIPLIGDVQVRNRGTLGGSVAHADPASDIPAILLALDASIVIRSGNGERVVAADGFFQGAFATDLGEDEILTEIRLPASPAGVGMAYRALEQPASGYSMVGVAAVIGRRDSSIGHVRVALTGVGEVAYRATAVEQALLGSDGSPAAIEGAAAHATDGQTVASDFNADAVYRAAMAVVHTRRAIEAA